MLKIVGTSLSQLKNSKAKYVVAVVVVIAILAIIPLSVQLSQESREDRSQASEEEATGTISGTVYDDKNYNGVMDATDPGLQKFTSIGFPIVLQLTETGPQQQTPKITEAYADESGKYQFQDITFNPDNQYVVRAIPQTGSNVQYALTTSDNIKVIGPQTVNFGFGSLVAIQSDVPKDTCVINFIPPSPGAMSSQFMRVFVRTNPDLSFSENEYSYETLMTGTGDKYGRFLANPSSMRMYPYRTDYRQMVSAGLINANDLLYNPTAPYGHPQAVDEFNARRSGQFDCAMSLKKGPQTIWTHTNSGTFDVMQYRRNEYYWNGATPTPAQACSVDINVSPSQITSQQTATLSWTSTNTYQNCEASGRWGGQTPLKGSQTAGAPGSLGVGNSTYTITCRNADGATCSDSTILTVGNGTNSGTSQTPTPTVTTQSTTNQAVFSLSPSTGSFAVGSTFKTKVFINSGTNPINVVETTVSFPSTKVELVDVDYTGSKFGIKAQESLDPDEAIIARGSQTPVSGQNEVAELTFKVKAGPIPMLLRNGVAVSSNTNQNLSVISQNAIFSVSTQTPTNTPTPIIVVEQFTPSITPQSRKLGDLNEDGLVNLNDLSILLSNYGKTTSTGDLNGDGKVTLFDLSRLLSNYDR